MASELNRNTIKDAIVAVLQANTSLYDPTGSPGELRVIQTGRPEDELNDAGMPYAFVRNSRGAFETIVPQNIKVSDASRLIEHELFFDIVVVVNEKDSRFAENALDDFQELILETIEENQDLNGSVDTSDPVRVSDFPMPSITNGKQGRVITISCTKVTS
jgi:hypothetical protein